MPTAKDSNMKTPVTRRRKELCVEEGRDRLHPGATMGTAPDYVLLEIFDFYLAADNTSPYSLQGPQHEDAWHTLVHVCKRWRWVVFASPLRLNLRLLCTNKRSMLSTLDVWPSFPLVIKCRSGMSRFQDANNIIAALKQLDRVYEIDIDSMPMLFLKKIRNIKLEGPIPKLTSLQLCSYGGNGTVLPDLFLNGPAPRLRKLRLFGVRFPPLEKLLISTHDLVTLDISYIPRSGFISPEAMVACVSALTRLESLKLLFRFPRSWASRESRQPPPLTRVVLPALALLQFKGDSEYLEDIVSRIDAPALTNTLIHFFNQLLFNTPLLCHFIGRTETLKAYLSHITFSSHHVQVKFFERKGTDHHKALLLRILCRPSEWQVSSLTEIFSSSLPSLLAPTLEHLAMYEDQKFPPQWQDDMENTQWMELLQPFTSVRDLELSGKLVRQVIPALAELTGERVTEVLPALQNISFRGPWPTGPAQDAVVQFIAAREHSGFPVTVRERREWNNSPFLAPS